jgi:hypothetical protein
LGETGNVSVVPTELLGTLRTAAKVAEGDIVKAVCALRSMSATVLADVPVGPIGPVGPVAP